MRVHRVIGRNNVVVSCADNQADLAEDLLDKLSELDGRGPSLGHGTTIDFGWTRLTLVGDENELMVCEPDYRGDIKDIPFSMLCDTLDVLASQSIILHRVGEPGVDARYLDKVVLVKGALSARSIFLERKAVSDPGDTGWYIGAVDEKGAALPVEGYEAIAVYQLLKLRPEVMQVLALPPGYLVVFIYDRIEIMLDPQGRQR